MFVENRPLILWFAMALVVAVFVAGGAAVSEVVLRGDFDPMAYYTRMPGWEIIFRPSREGTPGIDEDAHIKINELGLRGDMPTARSSPMILAVGGSTTEDIMLNDADMWTGRLQALLQKCMPNAWVGNMGKAGTNARHHALQIEKILPRLPRMDRVILLVGLNDMLFDAGLHHPAGLGAAWDLAQSFDYMPPDHPSWWQRSALIEAALRVWSHRSAVATADASTVRIVDFGKDESDYKKRFREVAPEDFVNTAPDNSGALTRYRAVLERIISLVQSGGAKVSFITQPFIWKDDMNAEERSRLYAGGFGSPSDWAEPHHKWMSTAAMAELLTSYDDTTRDVCAAHNLECSNLDREMPKDAVLFYDDFHYSKAGAARIAQIVRNDLYPSCN